MMTNAKAQFNATEAKAFRAVMAKYDNARVDIAAEIQKRNDSVANYRGMIITNGDIIEKLDATKDAATIAKRRAEIEDFQKRIETANAELAEYKKAQASRLADALALVTDDLYNAYAKYTVNPEDADLRDALIAALDKFFTDNGVVSGGITISAIISTMGNKGNGYGGKTGEFKTGECVKAKAKATFAKDFLLNLINIMKKVNALPAAKYAYVPVKLREKK